MSLAVSISERFTASTHSFITDRHHELGSCAPASWSAVTSEAIHRFGSGVRERSVSAGPRWFPIQSGDSEDFVAAVQNLAAFPKVHGKASNFVREFT